MAALDPVRIAIVGCGFWSQYQVAAWQELQSIRIVAVCDPDESRAIRLARELGDVKVHSSAEAMFAAERIAAVDVITPVETHPAMVRLAAARGVAVICQKPMAPNFAEAEQMVIACGKANVPFLIHENWRWQTPVRALKRSLMTFDFGRVIRARLDFLTGFSVFDNPFVPGMASRGNLSNLLSNLLPLLVLALGQTVVLITAGIDLSMVAVVGVCSVLGAWTMTETQYVGLMPEHAMAVPAAIVVMVGAGGAIGFVNGLAVTKLRMPPFIVTLVTWM